jgi:hypothetical protein
METPVEDPPSPPHLHQPPPAVHPPTSPWPIRPRASDALDVLTTGVQGQEAAPVADIQRLAGPNTAPGHSDNVQRLAAALGHLAAPTTDVQRLATVLGHLAVAPAAEVQCLVDALGHLATPAADVHRVAAAPGALAAPAAAPGALAAPAAAPYALASPSATPCAMAMPSCALDAQDVVVDGASPTDASVVALARSLMPTVPHPATEYNLPVLDVQRY